MSDYTLPRYTILYRDETGWHESKWRMNIKYAAIQYKGQKWLLLPWTSVRYYDDPMTSGGWTVSHFQGDSKYKG